MTRRLFSPAFIFASTWSSSGVFERRPSRDSTNFPFSHTLIPSRLPTESIAIPVLGRMIFVKAYTTDSSVEPLRSSKEISSPQDFWECHFTFVPSDRFCSCPSIGWRWVSPPCPKQSVSSLPGNGPATSQRRRKFSFPRCPWHPHFVFELRCSRWFLSLGEAYIDDKN